MELKHGYRKTELGFIPDDWEIISLGQIGQFKNGINKDSTSFGYGAPFVNLLDVFEKSYLSKLDGFGLLNSTKFEQKAYNLKEGDVLFVRSSVKPSGVGMTAVVLDNLYKTVYSGFLIRYRDNNRIDTLYKKYCFYEEKFRKKLISVSSISANTNINQDNLKDLKIPLPPTKAEQTAIAKALSDADAWIQSLTQLIAKKRQIKQGAMQTLLNPYENGRLKKGWVIKSIEEMCTPGGIVRGPFGGALKKDCFVDNGYKVYEQRNAIYRNIEIGTYYINQKKFQELKRFSIKPYDFIISCSGTIGRIYQIPREFTIGIINQALLKLTIETKFFSDKYFYHYFSWERFQNEIIDSTQGGAMKNLVGMPIFKSTKLALPEQLKEQEKIAKVLSDIDAAISELENKLNKAKQIKQGMMQNLLTGRIRLI